MTIPNYYDEQSYTKEKISSQNFLKGLVLEHLKVKTKIKVGDLPSRNPWLLNFVRDNFKNVEYFARELNKTVHDEMVASKIFNGCDYGVGNILELKEKTFDVFNCDGCNTITEKSKNAEFMFLINNNLATKSIFLTNHTKVHGVKGTFKTNEYQENIVRLIKHRGHTTVKYCIEEYNATSPMVVSYFLIG